MKVAFNLKPINAPFGGGNSVIQTLAEFFERQGAAITWNLNHDDIDVIFIADPRWKHPLRTFTLSQLSRYLILHPDTIVVHRINECDERKGTSNINSKLRSSNYIADSTIFVSRWLQRLDLKYKDVSGMKQTHFDSVILNGSDSRIFFPNFSKLLKFEKLRIVTHHWSPHPNKGLDLYLRLDKLLSRIEFASRFEFTYVGNLAKHVKFKNSTVVPPLFGSELGAELRSHDVYITGSINEPGGNHQNEGGLSGLPILYLDSGSMNEYCNGFGVQVKNPEELEYGLEVMWRDFLKLRENMYYFPHTSERMCQSYWDHLQELIRNRAQIRSHRRIFRDWGALLRLQFPV